MSREVFWTSQNDAFTSVMIVILGIKKRFRGDELVKRFDLMGVPYCIVDGLDASQVKIPQDWKNETRSHFMVGRSLTDAEIACSWGHWQAIKVGEEARADWILVIEDNVKPNYINEIYQALCRLQFFQPTLISFYSDPNFHLDFKKGIITPSMELKKCLSIPTSTKCYAVNLSGQRKLASDYEQYGFQGYLADFPLFYGQGLLILRSKSFRVEVDVTNSIIGSRQFLSKSSKFQRISSSRHGTLRRWLQSENSSTLSFIRFTFLRGLCFKMNSNTLLRILWRKRVTIRG
jgi:hypothetical protein